MYYKLYTEDKYHVKNPQMFELNSNICWKDVWISNLWIVWCFDDWLMGHLSNHAANTGPVFLKTAPFGQYYFNYYYVFKCSPFLTLFRKGQHRSSFCNFYPTQGCGEPVACPRGLIEKPRQGANSSQGTVAYICVNTCGNWTLKPGAARQIC